MPESARSLLTPFDRKINFLGRQVSIPRQAETYIRQRYSSTCMNEEVLTVENWKTAADWSTKSLVRERRPYSAQLHINALQSLLPDWAKPLHTYGANELLRDPSLVESGSGIRTLI